MRKKPPAGYVHHAVKKIERVRRARRARRRQDQALGEVHHGADYSREEQQFLLAMDRLKQRIGYRMPTWGEVLAAAKAAGWQRLDFLGPAPGKVRETAEDGAVGGHG